MTIERKRLLELALERLERERARVNQELEAIQAELKGGKGRTSRTAKKAPAKRGRRTMSAAERKAVSERMKKYWSQRKKAEKAAGK